MICMQWLSGGRVGVARGQHHGGGRVTLSSYFKDCSPGITHHVLSTDLIVVFPIETMPKSKKIQKLRRSAKSKMKKPSDAAPDLALEDYIVENMKGLNVIIKECLVPRHFSHVAVVPDSSCALSHAWLQHPPSGRSMSPPVVASVVAASCPVRKFLAVLFRRLMSDWCLKSLLPLLSSHYFEIADTVQ